LKLFPELKGVAAGSTGEQDYIDREMACLQEVLDGRQKVQYMQISRSHADSQLSSLMCTPLLNSTLSFTNILEIVRQQVKTTSLFQTTS
jgi:hypothetical protein